MKMPNKIMIGGLKWDLKEELNLRHSELDKAAWGQCSYKDQTLKVEKNLKEDNRAAVLLHELLHAIWSHQNLPSKEEEKCVTGLASELTAVFRSNPKLLKYLAIALK